MARAHNKYIMLHIYILKYTHILTHTFIHTHTHTHIYIYIYIHTHIHIMFANKILHVPTGNSLLQFRCTNAL